MAEAKKNGNAERAERLKERQDLQVSTLRGDVRDAVLRLVRELPDHWRKMTGGAQEDVIERIERMAASLVDQAVEIVTSRGTDAFLVRITKFNVDETKITATVTGPNTNELANALWYARGKDVALVARDAEQFKGEQAKAESDNIGDLAIPRGEASRVQETLIPPHAPSAH